MIKWFSPYRYFQPQDYEAFFEDLAKQGYHPKKIGHFSSFAMEFQKGASKNYKYVVDLQAFKSKDYVSLYKSFCWEYMGRMSNVFVWRKEYDDQKPSSFSDTESLRKRNARFSKAISFSAAASMLASLLLWTGFFISYAKGDTQALITLAVNGGVTFIMSAVLAALALIIYKGKKKVKKNN